MMRIVMKRIVMMVLCLVLMTAFGCGDDGDDTGVIGTSSAASSSTSGFFGGTSSGETSSGSTGRVWTASGVTGRGDLSAQGVPLVGNLPREDWCPALEACAGADFVALYGDSEAVEDACGCITSLRFCPGNAFDFASTDDPLYVRCEELADVYPVP